MSVFLNNFTIDQLETSKSALTLLVIGAGAIVWLGVYLEKDKFSEATKKRGWNLLVIGLAVETVVAAVLWDVDTVISTRQSAAIAARTPRIITPEKHDLLVSLLKSAPKGNVIVDSASMDAEASQFGDQIFSVLKDAGFNPTVPSFGNRAMAFNQPGAWFAVKDGKNPPPQATPIWKAFKQAGFTFTGQQEATIPDTQTVGTDVSSHP